MKIVTCKSGIKGWQARVQEVYDSYEEMLAYNMNFGISQRLGFKTTKAAWETNPLIQGSVNPEDFRVVIS